MCFINKVVFSIVLSLGGFSRLNKIYGVLLLSPDGNQFWPSALAVAAGTGTPTAAGWRWLGTLQPCLGCLPSPGLSWEQGVHGVCVGQLAARAPSPGHDWTGLCVLCAALCVRFLRGTARACPDSAPGQRWHWLMAEFLCSLSYCIIIKE